MKQKGNVLVIILAIVAALALAVGAYFYGQNQKLKNPAPTPPIASASISPSPTSTPSVSKATVVFEAEGSFSASEKAELQKKIINPFIDYYAETGPTLLTLTISKNDQASKDTYPYKAQAIFEGGGTQGFLIMKSGTGVEWWVPECLMKCVLSDAFKAKYPEIAAKVQ